MNWKKRPQVRIKETDEVIKVRAIKWKDGGIDFIVDDDYKRFSSKDIEFLDDKIEDVLCINGKPCRRMSEIPKEELDKYFAERFSSAMTSNHQIKVLNKMSELKCVSNCCEAEMHYPNGILHCKSCGEPCEAVEGDKN